MKPAPTSLRAARRLRLPLALALLAGVLAPIGSGAPAPIGVRAAAAQGDSAPARYARAAADGARLRNLGDVQAHQVMELEGGALLAVYGEKAGWLEVEVPGGVPVWVFGKYLEPTPVPDVHQVTGNGVNVRPRAAGGQANYPLGQLYAGDQVTVIARADEALPLAEDWVQIWSPPGIRSWVEAASTVPLAAGEEGAKLWRDALAALASAPRPRAPEQPAPAPAAGEAKAAPETTAAARAMELLAGAEALFETERARPTPDFLALRGAYEAVVGAAPSSPAARRARERLDHLGVMEQAAALKAELQAERERRQDEVLRRQEEAWEKSRKKDPLGQRFAGRGVLERRERVGSAPRYFLRFGGEDVCEVVCTSGRYDLDLYSGYDLGVQGEHLRSPTVEAGAGGARLAVLDARRLRVLAKR